MSKNSASTMNKITVNDIIRRTHKGKVVMITCYDYSFAALVDEAGVDIILVGDSLANVVLGLDQTRAVPLQEMFHHTRAVARGAQRALIVADMPYAAYQKNPARALGNARRFLACGAQAVKVEWFDKCPAVVRQLVKQDIAVMGHIGLTPQTVHLLGGFRMQGKDDSSAAKLIEQAKLLEDLGVFSIVLECIPSELSRRISRMLKIPTIGIGAGRYCDGQVLVLYDVLGLYRKKRPQFAKVYCDLSLPVRKAVRAFAAEVRHGKFPLP